MVLGCGYWCVVAETSLHEVGYGVTMSCVIDYKTPENVRALATRNEE